MRSRTAHKAFKNKMKIIENRILPFGSFVALTFWRFIFTKDASKLTDTVICHETIHYYQQAELAYLGFFVLYVLSFACQLIRCTLWKNIGYAEFRTKSIWIRAYRTTIFEREAYEHEDEPEYLEKRTPWAWATLNFIF